MMTSRMIALAAVLAAPAFAAAQAPDTESAEETAQGEVVLIEGETRVAPGSAHVIGAEELDRLERDDIHHVLASVPGVYLREEDGYGLRPNIGMRGAGSERSSKIALMEDGVLIAPAPYSAPGGVLLPARHAHGRAIGSKGSARST
jgi:Fe(3+) dicitrate transport protein